MLAQFFEFFDIGSKEFLRHLVSSFVMILLFSSLRLITVRAIGNSKLATMESKRNWIVFVKNITTVFLLIGLGVVWAKELQTFALSIAAVGAAVAISFKEYILCVMGGVYKASTQLFKIGDRIQINGFRGNVTDHDFLTTRVDEIGPGNHLHLFTGRSLTIPNSMFLSHPLINETGKANYGLHTFDFPAKRCETDLLATQAHLLKASQEVCSKFIGETMAVFKKSSEKEGFIMPSPQPRVSMYFPDPEDVIFVVRVPLPTKRKGEVQEAIMAKFFEISRPSEAQGDPHI